MKQTKHGYGKLTSHSVGVILYQEFFFLLVAVVVLSVADPDGGATGARPL